MNTEDFLLVGLFCIAAVVIVWIPFMYSLAIAKILRIYDAKKFALISAFTTYGVSTMFGSIVAFPIAVITIKVAPQICELATSSFLCSVTNTIDNWYEIIGWFLFGIVVLVSPKITLKWFWV